MKIAFLVGDFPTLSETFILNQITGLIDLGHEIHIYATRPQSMQAIHPDVESYQLLDHTYYAPSLPKNFLMRWLRAVVLFLTHVAITPRVCLRALNLFAYGRDAVSLRLFYASIPLIRERLPSYDVIHCHFGHVGMKGATLREIGAVSGHLSTTFHGWDVSQFLRMSGEQIYDPLFAQGDLFLPISEHWQQRLIELGCPADRILVHHMGINGQQFAFRPRQLNAGERIQIVSVARLTEKKGLEYAIRAIAKLKRDVPQITYKIIGGGPLQASLQTLIDAQGAGDVITLMGWQNKPTVIEILDTSHILLAPSVTSSDGDQEGIPVALMEAMAMGLVVVSTYHSGIPELIEDGVSGLLVPERDVEILAKQLRHLVEHPEMWAELAQAGRQRVQAGFNIEPLNQQLSEIFTQLALAPSRTVV